MDKNSIPESYYYLKKGKLVLHTPRSSRFPYKFLYLLGPGIIAALAGDDAGGIATYSVAGAQFGFKMLWLLVLLIPALSVVQIISVRLGVITGKGLTALIRERFSLSKAMIGIIALFLSNSITAISEFFGIAAALELFGVSKYIGIPIAAFVVWYLIVKGTYQRVEKLFLILSALFLSYVFASFFAKPMWPEVFSNLVIPTIEFNSSFLTILVATIATSITPYMQIYAQSAVVEKRLTIRDLKIAQIDAFLGAFLAIIIAIFIVITTGATLHPNNVVVETASDAAKALAPLAGNYASLLFGLGLFGASILSAGVLPLTTAFSTCEAFGWRSGVGYTFRQAPIFYSIFTLLIFLGMVITLIPGIPLIRLLILAYVINGFFLPIELIYMLKLSNDRRLMNSHTNGWLLNIFGYGVLLLICLALIFLFLASLPFPIFSMLGLK